MLIGKLECGYLNMKHFRNPTLERRVGVSLSYTFQQRQPRFFCHAGQFKFQDILI
jgi:hypothetical protein